MKVLNVRSTRVYIPVKRDHMCWRIDDRGALKRLEVEHEAARLVLFFLFVRQFDK
jgi:hypothetical protein